MKTSVSLSHQAEANLLLRRLLLACGILSSLWYVIINIYVPTKYEGYDLLTFTVSELSAIGAPTRKLWVILVVFYPVLFAAFGFGVLQSASNNWRMRVVGLLIIAYCVFNIYWPPMHQRGQQPTLTDTLHIVWASVTVLFMMVMMGFGAGAFGKTFRIYTLASLSLHLVFGILTSLEAPNIPINGPTPTIGLWERINIGVFMLWIAVLSGIVIARSRPTSVGLATKPWLPQASNPLHRSTHKEEAQTIQ
jgi:amino acid transporter